MSDEFITAPLVKEVSLASLTNRIESAGICYVDSATSSHVSLRWTEAPRRNSWPEDAELSVLDGKLLLTVHSGTAIQRKTLVEAVGFAASEELGEVVVFEAV